MKQPCAPIKASTGWTSKRSWAVGRSYVTLPQPFWADCRRAATNPATFSHLICPRSFHAQRGGAGLLLPGPQRLLRAIPAPSFTIKNNDHGRSRRPLRQFCISGCVPYLAHMYMYVKYCILLSVDTRPEADIPGATDRVVEEHRSRVELWICRAIEARASIQVAYCSCQTHQT